MRKQGAMKERPKDERMNGRINETTNRLKKGKILSGLGGKASHRILESYVFSLM